MSDAALEKLLKAIEKYGIDIVTALDRIHSRLAAIEAQLAEQKK